MPSDTTFNNISVISWLPCFIGGVYHENHRPAASLTNFIRNGVSSNKGVLIQLHKFCRKPFNEHSYHVRFQFAKWFQRRRLKSKSLDNGCQVIAIRHMTFTSLSCFIGGVYQDNHRPAASLTNFIRNGVSSNKGVLIADIYIQ
jgi:hypothetical protein